MVLIAACAEQVLDEMAILKSVIYCRLSVGHIDSCHLVLYQSSSCSTVGQHSTAYHLQVAAYLQERASSGVDRFQ